MQVQIDQDVCIGAGQCVMTSTVIFAQGDDDGLGMVLKSELVGEEAELAEEAVQLCPTGAIRLVGPPE